MADTHLVITASIPLPEGAGARVAGAIWHDLDPAVTALMEAVGKHGGTVETDSVRRAGPRKPAAPLAVSKPPIADLAQVAEIGTAVEKASKPKAA
jgi:hypothetical protein